MPAFINLTGEVFGRLIVLSKSEVAPSGSRCWLCECSCGTYTVVSSDRLRQGGTKSCGCLQKEIVKKATHRSLQPKMDRKEWLVYSTYIGTKRRTYGVSEEEIRAMMDRQKGCCDICKESLDHLNRNYCIDHSHTTNEVRGLLCSKCNTGIGQFNDSPESLRSAIEYLDKRSIFNSIVRWNKDRGIPKVFNLQAEYDMLSEELSELKTAPDEELQVDALADIVVVAIGALWKLGYDPTIVMEETLKEINSRGGSFDASTGKWKKVVTGEEYTANYNLAEVGNG